MKKMSIAQVLVFVLLIAFASFSIAQMAGKPWEKTVKLSNGELILDLSGEWDIQSEFYGPFSFIPRNPPPDIVTITQVGTEFSALKQTGNKWLPAGSETFKGELDKDGFKAVYGYAGTVEMDGNLEWTECNWEISNKGNKLLLDCGERVKSTLTRK